MSNVKCQISNAEKIVIHHGYTIDHFTVEKGQLYE